tara:strand:+ start:131 stop:1486 length:1356 start_codon:yes stop_codon:yes gene_type:complete
MATLLVTLLATESTHSAFHTVEHPSTTPAAADAPNIIFIVSDDLGYNDVSFHGGFGSIPTPNIDALANGGVILERYYVQPVCSPSRATFATGRHVIHTGVYDPMNGGSGDLSKNFSLWSDGFKAAGYTVHNVGKWHLGMSSWQFTPLERGFESYYGYLGGGETYWTHQEGSALAFWDDYEPALNSSCSSNADSCPVEYYSADVFTAQAQGVIEAASMQSKPLFLYLAYQSVHSPDEAPQALIDRFNSTMGFAPRRTFGGMVTALDLGIGEVVKTLKETKMYDKTFIVFTTDNGGPADGFNSNWACNWPLRGMKRTLFEGGLRGVGLVHGAGLMQHAIGTTAAEFVHATDWFHTLLRLAIQGVAKSAAGTGRAKDYATQVRALFPSNEPKFELGDGMDVWDYLSGAMSESPRLEMIHEAHPQTAEGKTDGNGEALRVGDLKIVIRSGGQVRT